MIRGHGAAIWGANAVNGVINIITKTVSELDRDRLFLSINTHRGDSHQIARHNLTIPGSGLPAAVDPVNGFRNEAENGKNRGGNLVLNWRRTLSEDSALEFQLHYDQRRRGYGNQLGEVCQTFERSFQHELHPREGHELIWGLNARVMLDRIDSTLNIDFGTRDNETEAFYSGFLKDEIALTLNLLLTVGPKLGWNTFTGWGAQPSGRLIWKLTERQRFWTALSRAVQTPTRAERDFASLTQTIIPGGVPPCPGPGGCPLQLLGNPDMESEVLVAHELGYQIQASEALEFDFAAFYNDYENAVVITPTLTGTLTTTSNRGTSRAHGLEASGREAGGSSRAVWHRFGSVAPAASRAPATGSRHTPEWISPETSSSTPGSTTPATSWPRASATHRFRSTITCEPICDLAGTSDPT